MQETQYVSMAKFCKIAGLGQKTVLNMCLKGELFYIKTDGGHYRIRISDIESERIIRNLREENTKLKEKLLIISQISEGFK